MKTEVLRPFETTWEDWKLGGGVQAAFADPALPLEVELGPAEDDFLLRSAAEHPETNWLGIEYSRKRVHRYVRRMLDHAGPLGNLRLAWRPAADVVGEFLGQGCVQTYHVHFPDPWPKKHHHRYRMLTAPFLGDLAGSLVAGGEIVVLTDHREYAEEVAELGGAEPALEHVLPAPGWRVVAPGEQETVFEAQWRAEGLEIHLIRLRRASMLQSDG